MTAGIFSQPRRGRPRVAQLPEERVSVPLPLGLAETLRAEARAEGVALGRLLLRLIQRAGAEEARAESEPAPEPEKKAREAAPVLSLGIQAPCAPAEPAPEKKAAPSAPAASWLEEMAARVAKKAHEPRPGDSKPAAPYATPKRSPEEVEMSALTAEHRRLSKDWPYSRHADPAALLDLLRCHVKRLRELHSHQLAEAERLQSPLARAQLADWDTEALGVHLVDLIAAEDARKRRVPLVEPDPEKAPEAATTPYPSTQAPCSPVIAETTKKLRGGPLPSLGPHIPPPVRRAPSSRAVALPNKSPRQIAPRPNKYADKCASCAAPVPAKGGVLRASQRSGYLIVVCSGCAEKGPVSP